MLKQVKCRWFLRMKSADVTGKMRRFGVADFWHTAGSTCFWLPRTFLQVISNAYEGRSINKLQNGAIPLILKIGKIRNIRFVGNLILKIHRNFSDDDVIIVTSSVHRTQFVCVLFSPPVSYHNSSDKQHRNEKKRISLTSLCYFFKC